VSAAPSPFEVDLGAILALPENERREELGRLQQLDAVLKSNPLWRYVPHEGERGWRLERGLPLTGGEERGQVAFHEIDLPYGAYVAGNRSGKTHCGTADALVQTLPLAWLPPWLHAYKRMGLGREVYLRVVGVDLPQWLEKVMLPKLRKLVPAPALWKGEFDRAYNDRKRKLQFADGSWWDFLTHDMEIGAFAGADLDRVWFDEEPPGERGRQQYEESLGRLADRDGEVRWTLTPLLGLTFVYDELTDRDGNPRDDEECRVVRGDIDHNPHLSETGRARFLRRFASDPLKLEARKSGRWVHFQGLIFDEWSKAKHVVPDRAVPEGAKCYEGIDPGIASDHPAGFVAAFMLDGVLEVFHVHKIWKGTAADMAAHIHETREQWGYRPAWTVIDPVARNKQHQTGRSTQDEYRKHRIYALPGQNSRQASYNAIKERLRGEAPQLVVQASCVDGTLVEEKDLGWEMEHYRWKRKPPKSEAAAPAEPVKIDDDLIDPLRYLVMQLPENLAKASAEEPRDEHPAARAFRENLKRIGRRAKSRRVGGVIPV
jgi:phage terminase large subunit-like protein